MGTELELDVVQTPLFRMDMMAPPRSRIVVPYATTQDTWLITRQNLQAQGIEAEYVDVTGRGSGYPDLFRQLWADGEPFILVEHDILPWHGALNLLDECEEPYCGFVYQVRNHLETWLGCTKFEPARLGEVPLPPELDFWQFDVPVTAELANAGYRKHVHGPAVVHINPGLHV